MFLGKDLDDFTENELLLICDPDLKPTDFKADQVADLCYFIEVNNLKSIVTRRVIARVYEIYLEALEDPLLTPKEMAKMYTNSSPSGFYAILKKYGIVMPVRAVKFRTGIEPLIDIIRRNDNAKDFLADFHSIKKSNGYPGAEARYWFEIIKSIELYLKDGSNREQLEALLEATR